MDVLTILNSCREVFKDIYVKHVSKSVENSAISVNDVL